MGKKTYEKRPTINIQNFELTCEDSVKLLGIEIDYQLNFDTHISTICRKASQQLNIIKRLGPYLNRLNKLTIFHTFILSNFSFCPLAWHFCTEKHSKKIEKVQERALRFVYEDYNSSYDNLLKKQRCLPCRFVEWELWPWKQLRLWINCRHHVSITLCIYEIQNIILDTTIYWTFHRSEHQGMPKKHLNLLLLHCGTASQTISGLKTVFLNLRA